MLDNEYFNFKEELVEKAKKKCKSPPGLKNRSCKFFVENSNFNLTPPSSFKTYSLHISQQNTIDDLQTQWCCRSGNFGWYTILGSFEQRFPGKWVL
jgi:hypothetical protein